VSPLGRLPVIGRHGCFGAFPLTRTARTARTATPGTRRRAERRWSRVCQEASSPGQSGIRSRMAQADQSSIARTNGGRGWRARVTRRRTCSSSSKESSLIASNRDVQVRYCTQRLRLWICVRDYHAKNAAGQS
jgi:hypothetical protein